MGLQALILESSCPLRRELADNISTTVTLGLQDHRGVGPLVLNMARKFFPLHVSMPTKVASCLRERNPTLCGRPKPLTPREERKDSKKSPMAVLVYILFVHNTQWLPWPSPQKCVLGVCAPPVELDRVCIVASLLASSDARSP